MALPFLVLVGYSFCNDMGYRGLAKSLEFPYYICNYWGLSGAKVIGTSQNL
jgi:hypothetical protein